MEQAEEAMERAAGVGTTFMTQTSLVTGKKGGARMQKTVGKTSFINKSSALGAEEETQGRGPS